MSRTDSTIMPIVSDTIQTVVLPSAQTDSLVITVLSDTKEEVHPTESKDLVPGWLILGIIALSIILYFGLTLIKTYIIPAFKAKSRISKIDTIWYRITVILWLAFALFSIYSLLKSSLVIASILIGLVIILGYQFLLDFCIGVYYKFEHQIRIGDHFILNDISGEIIAFRSRHLQIRSPKNEDILIPYRQLLSTAITITKQLDNLKRKTIVLEIKGEVTVALNRLRDEMTRCPWIYNPKHFKIEHIEGETYHVHLLAKEDFTLTKAEDYIKSKMG